MALITKGWLFLRQYGIKSAMRQTVQKIIRETRRLPFRIAEKLITRRRIKALHEKAQDKRVFVIIPGIDWNIPLYQRPHQIAVELAKKNNSFVLFFSDQYKYDRISFDQQISENLHLYSLTSIKHINSILANSKDITVVLTWPRNLGLLSKFKYNRLVYEYIDELSLFYYHTPKMDDDHIHLMRTADLTVATADKLYENAVPYAKHLILCENACDYHFFASSKNTAVHPIIAIHIKNYEAVLGYYGCLAYWFDYETVLWAARQRPEWLFVLVGHDFDGTLSVIHDSKLSNILYVPAQPYTNLPAFLAGFDITLIPFVINDVTLSTSPVKVFEYMAAAKPVLSSDIPECRKYKSVYRYTTAEDFLIKAQELIELKSNADYLSLLDEEARQNTWESRVNYILNSLEETE